MKRLSVFFSFLLLAIGVKAQQDPQFTQNMFNRLPVNPAYAGARGSICATLLMREQWIGFEGNPRTNVFSVDVPFKFRQSHQLGTGISIIQDEIGPINSLNIKVPLAYHYRIAQGVLSGGLELGIFNQSIKGDWRTSEGNFDGTEDPFIPNDEAGATTFDLGLGVYYYTKELYVGLSTTHLNSPTISDKPDENSEYSFKQVSHYYVMAGYNYPLSTGAGEFELQPSIFAKSDGVSTQVDMSCTINWCGLAFPIGLTMQWPSLPVYIFLKNMCGD